MNTDNLRSLFNQLAPFYDEHIAIRKTTLFDIKLSIIDSFIYYIKGRVLDIATGTGTIAKSIKDKTNCEVYGIDFSEEMIREARKKCENINFKIANADNLPYDNNSFDTIICAYGFYWFEDPINVVKEIRRVLKSKGFFILLELELNKGAKLKITFSEEYHLFLKELTDLELKTYKGVEFLENIIIRNGFSLMRKVYIPVDDFSRTVGWVYQNFS